MLAAISAAAIALTAAVVPDNGMTGSLDVAVKALSTGTASAKMSALPMGDDEIAPDINLTDAEQKAIDDALTADYEKADAYAKAHPKASVSPLTNIDHTSYIFYDQMNAAEKKLWDDLADACDSFMTSTVNLTSSYTYNKPGKEYDGFTIYCYKSGIKYNTSEISDARAKNISELFFHCNPQYYFWYSADQVESKSQFNLWTFTDCAKYSDRVKFEDKIYSKTMSWLTQIKAQESVYAKELLICDIIRDNVEYDYPAYYNTDPYDWHDQTLLGAIYDETCVCAGYSQMFTYLCQAAGIEAFAVRKSGTHRWNRVNIYGTWYEVDTTWYDTTGNSKWLNKSHEYILANDSTGSHKYTESYYTDFVTLPDCVDETVYTVDSVSVSTLPKTEYFVGDKINVKGGKVTAYLTNNKSFTADLADCTVSGFSSKEAGIVDVKVKYEGKETTYPVTIGEVVATGMKITSLPKTTYLVDEALSVQNGKITVTYNNGKTSGIDMTESMVSGYDPAKLGTQELTVTYNGLSETYSVKVITAPITVNGQPFADFDSAFAAVKNIKGEDVNIVVGESGSLKKSVSLPTKANSIMITAASRDVTLTFKNASLSFSCPVTISNISLRNSKSLPMPITAKKDLTLENTAVGIVKAAGDADISGCTVKGALTASGKTAEVKVSDSDISGNFTQSGKDGTATLTDVSVTGNLTAAGRLELLGDCSVGGKLTPKGAFRVSGHLTVMS